MCHQLGAEVTDGEEVVRSFNQLLVLLIEDRQPVGAHGTDGLLHRRRYNSRIYFIVHSSFKMT